MGGRKIPDERERDLFGNPVRERRGQRGRPALEVSDEDRDMVDAALARGWSNDRIARAVGISPASLKRHFGAALAKRDAARDRLELAAFARTTREALDGNMSAMRQLRAELDRDELRAQKRRLEEAQAKRPAAKGKKEAAREAAQEVPAPESGWGTLLN